MMGGRGAAYIVNQHISKNDDFSPETNFFNDPEIEYQNEMFKKLKSLGISTRQSTDQIDDKILERQQKQIYNIVSKYKNIFKYTTQVQDIQFGAENIKKTGLLAFCSPMIEHGQIVQRIVLDSKQLANYDKMLNTVDYGIKTHQFVEVNQKFKSRDYLITHEFGHAMENSIFEKIRQDKGLTFENLTQFSVFREKQGAIIKNEVIDIWKKYCKTGKEDDIINLSKYSGETEREWFAETFTNLELAENPAPISKALEIYLRRYNL